MLSQFRNMGFNIFSGQDCDAMLQSKKEELINLINRQKDNYLLNVNKEEYIQYLISEYSINPLEINFNNLFVSTHEERIPAEYFPQSYSVYQGKHYPKDIIVYHLPYIGSDMLLKLSSTTYGGVTHRVTIKKGCISFKIINFDLSAEEIKKKSEEVINYIESQNINLTNNLVNFNSSIYSLASKVFDERKEKLLKKCDLMKGLGVPIKESTNTPSTFSVPAKRTKVISTSKKIAPKVNEKNYAPEPTLDITIYNQIMKIIHDVGTQFEKLPSTYSEKEEEHLRDHFLLFLEPNFEGSASGETFNKSGKTDILLRHDSKNVFIAELKFWHGQKKFLGTISQLIGYLTWRDSKSAIVMFVRNKDFTNVLETAKKCISEHDNYLGFVEEHDEGWYQYRFHINNDINREIMLSVMLFHIPN